MFLFALKSQIVLALEPLAPLTAAMQPVWQAGTPITVNVDYDVPVYGLLDAASAHHEAELVEAKLLQMRKRIRGAQ